VIDQNLVERVFVIVVERDDGRRADEMPLLVGEGALAGSAPVFSSMQHATGFLSRAQELGHQVKLDYIFPADRRRLAEDFPGYQFRLDPSPDAFFQPSSDS
jgi:hypothetical protein